MRLSIHVIMIIFTVLIGGTVIYQFRKEVPKKLVPASVVATPVHEEQLNNVILSDEAEKRLGIKLSAVQTKTLPHTRLYGGEITVPAGQSVIVAAPLGGVLQAPAEGMAKPGQQVKKDQVIFMLSPTLTAEARTTLATSRVDADGQLRNAEAQEQSAKIALDRAKRLFRDQVGSKRNVDEMQAIYDVASKSLQAARERRKVLGKAVDAGTLEPVPVVAPQSGILRAINSLPGQNVPSNTPLFELANIADVWVKVSLPVGDMNDIQRNAPVQIGSLSARTNQQPEMAYPVSAPPSANPLLGTVDVFYAMAGDNNLVPGQRVGVTISLKAQENAMTIPWSAIIFDIYGSAWVYEWNAVHSYKRHRVEIGHTVGNEVVVNKGLSPNMKLVVIGAQEIFGAETGFTK